MKITYIGHSCFAMEMSGTRILTDPFISKNPLAEARVADFSPDLILVSHDHFDHVGDAEAIAKANACEVLCEKGLAQKLRSRGVDVISGSVGDSVALKGLEINFVKAVHSSDSGVAVGFVIKTKEHTLYFAGDTDIFDSSKIAEKYMPDIAILPIGGVYTIDPAGALEFLRRLKPKIVIPMHYRTFENLYGTPQELEKLISKEKLDIRQITLNINQTIEI